MEVVENNAGHVMSERGADEPDRRERQWTQTNLVRLAAVGTHAAGYVGWNRRRRRELVTTDTDESAMAADAAMGSSSRPKNG